MAGLNGQPSFQFVRPVLHRSRGSLGEGCLGAEAGARETLLITPFRPLDGPGKAALTQQGGRGAAYRNMCVFLGVNTYHTAGKQTHLNKKT